MSASAFGDGRLDALCSVGSAEDKAMGCGLLWIYSRDKESSVNFLCGINTFQRDTQCSCTDCLLILRCQLYMFRTVTVHPQGLLFRCCMCRLWYVARNSLPDTSRWYNVWGPLIRRLRKFFLKRCTSGTYQVVNFLPYTIVCTYSI